MSLHDADTKGTDPQDMIYSSKDSVALCILTVNNFTHDEHAHIKNCGFCSMASVCIRSKS